VENVWINMKIKSKKEPEKDDFYEDICSECGMEYIKNSQKICNNCRGKIISKQQKILSNSASESSEEVRK
jgi:DNA-directed RNA polymerase subunit RPC12/RpoP